MNKLVLGVLLLFVVAGPAYATEPGDGFGNGYFSNKQLPGFSDPETGPDDAAAQAAEIAPAAGDETGNAQAEAPKSQTALAPKPATEHDVPPIGPASAIGSTPDDLDKTE